MATLHNFIYRSTHLVLSPLLPARVTGPRVFAESSLHKLSDSVCSSYIIIMFEWRKEKKVRHYVFSSQVIFLWHLRTSLGLDFLP